MKLYEVISIAGWSQGIYSSLDTIGESIEEWKNELYGGNSIMTFHKNDYTGEYELVHDVDGCGFYKLFVNGELEKEFEIGTRYVDDIIDW